MDKQQSCYRTRRIRLTYYSLTSLRNVNSSNESIKPIHDFSKSKFIDTKFSHSQILFELSQHLSFEYSVTVRDVSLYPAKNHLEIFQFLRSDPVLWKFPRFSWLHAHSEYAFSETEDRQQGLHSELHRIYRCWRSTHLFVSRSWFRCGVEFATFDRMYVAASRCGYTRATVVTQPE